MGILDQGCTCDSCLPKLKEALSHARAEWKQGKREIVFESFSNDCADGCCTDYGTTVYVNGFEILSHNGEDANYVIEALMEFLEIEGVTIDYEYEVD